jgi:hypothetical protein
MTNEHQSFAGFNTPTDEQLDSVEICRIDSPSGWYLCPVDWRVLAHWTGQRWSGLLYPIKAESYQKAHSLLLAQFGYAGSTEPTTRNINQAPNLNVNPVWSPDPAVEPTVTTPFTPTQSPTPTVLFGNTQHPYNNVPNTVPLRSCDSCQRQIATGLVVCNLCGVRQNAACSNCGAYGSSRFCVTCGSPR